MTGPSAEDTRRDIRRDACEDTCEDIRRGAGEDACEVPRQDLARAQGLFAAAVRDLAAPWPPELLARVVPGGTLDADAALGVYRGGYVARLTEQLGETFATVWRVLGDEDFFAACAGYIAGHPSSSYNLSDYGRGFADFLASSPLGQGLAFLPELARFELEFHDLFHAEGHEPAAASEAAALAASGDLSGATLRFGPALRLLALEHAVHDLFRHRDDVEAPSVDVERPQWVMLFKKNGEVRALDVDAGTFAALGVLASGATLDDALAAAVDRDPAFGEAEAARLLEILVASGVVTRWTA